jgi:hypothetical protein
MHIGKALGATLGSPTADNKVLADDVGNVVLSGLRVHANLDSTGKVDRFINIRQGVQANHLVLHIIPFCPIMVTHMNLNGDPKQLLHVQEIHVIESLGAVVATKKVQPPTVLGDTDGRT